MQPMNFSPTPLPRGSRRQVEDVNETNFPIVGPNLRERLEKAQERRWPYIQGFRQDRQGSTGTKLLSDSERGLCSLRKVLPSPLKESYHANLAEDGGIDHLLAQDLPARRPWLFETAVPSYHTEAQLMPAVCRAIQVFEPYLHAPVPEAQAHLTRGATGRLSRYHLFLVGRKTVIQQIDTAGSRPDAGLAVHLMESWGDCAQELAKHGITITMPGNLNATQNRNRQPNVNRQGNVNPPWFKGRIFNCEVKKDSSLRSVLHKIQALSKGGVKVLPSQVSRKLKDHCMYVQVAYQMQTSCTEWATLESPDYIIICHMKESEHYHHLYVDGPYRRHETVPKRPQMCTTDLDIFTWHDYFEFVAFAWGRALKAEAKRANLNPNQIWPEGATVLQQAQPDSGQLPRALHGSLPSSIDVLANMRGCLSKLADLTGVSAMRRWCADVAMKSCTKAVYHSRDGGTMISRRLGQALLPRSSLLEDLVGLVLPREIHLSWESTETLPRGRDAECRRVRFWGQSYILKCNHIDASTDSLDVVGEYNALRGKHLHNQREFTQLPIPKYFGLFVEEWDGDCSHTSIMSDNGNPVDWDNELADEFRGDHRAAEVADGIARLQHAGFRASDHEDFHNVLYDGNRITFCDFCQ
ncbi:hypothetical protein C8Q80DRAFT_322850 [Daedaleopsis nitida]|nr:hypothetical protein C8Q80DRAFT_440232 [Daedaleopsis nitida]KAI0737429.1 hypothetical protein C8Q80DRAFT_322850 [Daedaleopsis nitida]